MPATEEAPEHEFRLVGNLPCLDFVNTEVMSQGRRVDLLSSYERLTIWGRSVGFTSPAEARGAIESWDGTRQGSAALRDGIALRRALRRMAETLAAGKAPGSGLVSALNETLALGARVVQLDRRDGRYVTSRPLVQPTAGALLVQVAESAAWLLEHGDPAQVHPCENPNCILFFYDVTKNKRRRWCAMDACGSRAKAAAYYRRTRALEA